MLPRIRGWLVVDELVTAACDTDDDEDKDDNDDDDDIEAEPELTKALPLDPEATGLVFEDAGTSTDELLDTPCESTTEDRLAVELVGFTPGTPA